MPRRPDLPCSSCGELMWRGSTSRPEGLAVCQPCRRALPTYRIAKHATRVVVIIDVWRCCECGVACQREVIKGAVRKLCDVCRLMRANSWTRVTPTVRRAIYERDGWSCGICQEPVDASLIGSHSVWRPALDHILPKSRGGSDDPANLRLAHWWCNSALNDGRTYTDSDFRVAA